MISSTTLLMARALSRPLPRMMTARTVCCQAYYLSTTCTASRILFQPSAELKPRHPGSSKRSFASRTSTSTEPHHHNATITPNTHNNNKQRQHQRFSTAKQENDTAAILSEHDLAGSTDASTNQQLYDNWAEDYDHDTEAWGYDMPQQVASLVAQHIQDPNGKYVPHRICLLDCGAGSGLVGQSLRQHDKFDDAYIIGGDISKHMLRQAKQRGCYDSLVPLDLNEVPFCVSLSKVFLQGCSTATSLNVADALTCVGTLTYVSPDVQILHEFCRWVKPGGIIAYTLRTDKLAQFAKEEAQLEADGVWTPLETKGPLPYLPHHPDYADDIQVVIRVYQKL